MQGGDNVQLAPAWQAPLPQDGQLVDLRRWWALVDDPLMTDLVEAAQRASPTLARAVATIADARAARVAGGARLLPALDMTADVARGRSDLAAPAGTLAAVGLQAGWELDLFGANRAGVDAAAARLDAAQAGWHDARIAVAAEVAWTYVELRACEAHGHEAALDAGSRAQTAQLTEMAAAAGMRAPATAALARAIAAQGQVAVVRQQAQCDLLVKALVALTAQSEPVLRRDLAGRIAELPRLAAFDIAAVPAAVLAQRPDIHAAASDVAAAGAAWAQADARRWPRITLAGSIGPASLTSLGTTIDGAVWSIGPVAVTFPLFDGGAAHAHAQAAQVRYVTAQAVYAARLRDAIQEVERALVTLESTARRREDAGMATDGFERSYHATAASYAAGAASLFELEDARRSLVSTRRDLIDLRRERLLAWIALYRSIGGGWTPAALSRN